VVLPAPGFRGNAAAGRPGPGATLPLLAMDFKHTKFSFGRPITSYAKVQAVIARIIRNRPFHINRERLRKKDYLDVGCGPNTHEHFINLDYGWRPGIDICWNIAKGIPLDDRSVSGVFSEHCLEHVSLEAVDFVLSEFWRVLRPGGSLRIVVPDGELYLTRYTDIIRRQSNDLLPYAHNDRYHGTYSPIMSVNRVFRSHGHLFIYDFDTLSLLLTRNRFIDVKKECYMSGRDPQLLIDTEHRAVESLYVEASKPRAEAASNGCTG
jgi:predicted SAM-dependent methyltransferase